MKTLVQLEGDNDRLDLLIRWLLAIPGIEVSVLETVTLSDAILALDNRSQYIYVSIPKGINLMAFYQDVLGLDKATRNALVRNGCTLDLFFTAPVSDFYNMRVLGKKRIAEIILKRDEYIANHRVNK